MNNSKGLLQRLVANSPTLLTAYGKLKILDEHDSSFGENESIYAYIIDS